MAAPSKLSPVHPFLPTWESSTYLDSTEGWPGRMSFRSACGGPAPGAPGGGQEQWHTGQAGEDYRGT